MKTTAYLRNLVYVIIAAAILWIAAYATVRHLGTVLSGMGGLIAAGTDAGAWAVPHGSLTEFALLEGIDLEAGTKRILEKF